MFLAKHKVVLLGDVTIQILPPVQTEGITKDKIDDLIKKTRDPMIEALKSTHSKQEWKLNKSVLKGSFIQLSLIYEEKSFPK